MRQAEAADRMVPQRKRQRRPEAFRTNYSFCRDTNTSRRRGIQPKSSARAGSALSLQSTCQTFTHLFIQMCIILKACVFNLVSVFASLGYTPTLLMTPVPCNFFSVQTLITGWESSFKPRIIFCSYCFALAVFNTGPAAVCLNSRVYEAVFNTKSDLAQQPKAASARGYRFLMPRHVGGEPV